MRQLIMLLLIGSCFAVDLVDPNFESAYTIQDRVGLSGSFEPIPPGSSTLGYLKYFHLNGQPKFNYTKVLLRKFPNLNHPSPPKEKFKKIYEELMAAADRTEWTPKSFLMLDSATAKDCSIGYEKSGIVCPHGAWSIAVQQTAVRHGFPKAPCAEFQSELIREAYARAGYDATEDFNEKNDNQLIWNKSAAVVNLASALYKAGWVPWEPSKFRPPIGAIMMNQQAQTPGHTFMVAGFNGQIVMDNAAPQGRDLDLLPANRIAYMYQGGVFWLPPGINPAGW
jgi:hypothetical protein